LPGYRVGVIAMIFEYWFDPAGNTAYQEYLEEPSRLREMLPGVEGVSQQALDRTRFFAGYRLRMAELIRDYGSDDRDQAPADSRRAHV
jgi:hypothetical protein